MQLLRLHLVNFRQHQLTEIEFGPGLTGIVGSNGAGKTTLLEAIAYALYGVPAVRGTRETLRRRRATPREKMEVELELQFGAHRYRVVRSLTMAELFQDGRAIANSTGAVTDRVTAMFHMTREAFFNTYFTGQKELAVMAAMGRTERGQFLSGLLGYDKLQDAQDGLREQRSALRSQLVGIEQGLVDPNALEVELAAAAAALERARSERDAAHATERVSAERVAALAPQWNSARERRATWQALDGEQRLAEGRVAAARAGFQALDRELATALRARDRLIDVAAEMLEWGALTTERETLDQAAMAYSARSKSGARRDQAGRRLGELEPQLTTLADAARVTAFASVRAEVLAAREAVDRQLAERRTRWTQDVQEAKTRLEGFRERYKELKEQRGLIEEQGPEGICPTCGRPLGKDYRTLLDLLARQMEEVTTDGNYFRQRVGQLGAAPADVAELDRDRDRLEQEIRRTTEALGQAHAQLKQREELDAERARLVAELATLETELAGPAATYDAARHERVRQRLGELDPVRREHDQLFGLAQRAETLVAEAAVAEQKMSEAEAEQAALDQRIAALAWDPEAFVRLEAAVRDAEGSLQLARVSVARATAALEGAERLRESASARQADRAQKADIARRLGEQIGLLEELDSAFSELRTKLNLELRPDLAAYASKLLQDLTAGRYTDLDLDEGYIPTIVEDGEAKAVISGGEEDVVNLALRLAISQMLAERAGQPLSVLVLDEIFGSLDEERRGAVLELLRALSDRFPQVILITHVDGMQDAFDRVLRASYDAETGVSTVRDETPESADVAA